MEFFREFTNLSFPAGIQEDLLTDRIVPGSQQNQTASYCFARTVNLATAAEVINVVFRIPEDYHYHLDQLRVSYPKLPGPADAPELQVKIVLAERGRSITPEPLPLPMRLISTPGQEQIRRAAQNLNLTFIASSLITLQFFNFNTIVGGNLHVITEGLRIPIKNYTYV